MARHAPDDIIELVKGLPSDREFHNINEVWTAIGGHVESERF
jgi:hypothetical protein